MRLIPARNAAQSTLNVMATLPWNVVRIRYQAVDRHGREVHDRVEPVGARGHTVQRVQHLPVVGEVDSW